MTNGKEIYPHREDLYTIPIWICDTCGNYVGCHYRSENPLKPLGVIPTPRIMNARKHIHALLDPMWRHKYIKRRNAYKYISRKLGYEYHTGNIRSIEEAKTVYRIILELKKEVYSGTV